MDKRTSERRRIIHGERKKKAKKTRHACSLFAGSTQSTIDLLGNHEQQQEEAKVDQDSFQAVKIFRVQPTVPSLRLEHLKRERDSHRIRDNGRDKGKHCCDWNDPPPGLFISILPQLS